MSDLIKLSQNIQTSIFEYNINEFNTQVIELITLLQEELEHSINNKNEDMFILLKRIIDDINFAFSNKDYLLFADILKYELEPNLK